MELWTLCRKPLIGTVANNVLEYGTGGINIDGCRVPAEEGFADWVSKTANPNGTNKGIGRYGDGFQGIGKTFDNYKPKSDARFPANLIHDGSDEVVDVFPNGSSRFFYCAKASKAERNMGCEGLAVKNLAGINKWTDVDYRKGNGEITAKPQHNHHPTVKPVSLMRYLCRLITPPRGMVLDPYMGSGSTGIACKLEGFDFTGIEIDPEYIKIAEARINSVKQAVLV
jgi:site-specific DNA-methyltransferase (adenine-specific)